MTVATTTAVETVIRLLTTKLGVEVAAVLVERGAALNSPDREGLTPAQHAARHGHADVLEFLEEHGAARPRVC